MGEGCEWCTSIGSSVLTAVHLDFWYHSANTPTSSNCGSVSSAEAHVDNVTGPDTDTTKDESTDWEDAAGSSDEIEPQQASSLTASALDCDTMLRVNMKFRTTASVLSTIKRLDVRIECCETVFEGGPFADLRNEQAVEVSFEVYQDGITTDIQVEKFGLEDSLAQATIWLEDCAAHPRCKVNERTFLPTRLIAIEGSEARPKARIISTHDSLDQGRYVALSYIWGPSQTYTLTIDTLAVKTAALDTRQLPKTILDAIQISKGLGFSYLWVDALCIIQDSSEDKVIELAQMHRVYQCSALTIVAANAHSSSQGFLQTVSGPSFFVEPFEITSGGEAGGQHRSTLALGYRSYYLPNKDPINRRAWTLQERVLSSRLLYHSYDGMKWSCPSTFIDPGAPEDAPPTFPKLISSEAQPVEKHELMEEDEYTAFMRERWLDLRAEYTERQLTYPDADKLAAIAAVAEVFALNTKWSYIAGMWQEYLLLDLHWHRDTTSLAILPGRDEPLNPLRPRPSRYRAPSWSWAAIDGHVVSTDDPREPFCIRILTCNADLVDSRLPFGSVKGGALEVVGKAINLRWRWASEEDSTNFDDGNLYAYPAPSEGTDYILGQASVDAMEDGLVNDSVVLCLALSVMKHEHREMALIKGLILLPCAAEKYRRIGFCRLGEKSPFDQIPERHFSIV